MHYLTLMTYALRPIIGETGRESAIGTAGVDAAARHMTRVYYIFRGLFVISSPCDKLSSLQ